MSSKEKYIQAFKDQCSQVIVGDITNAEDLINVPDDWMIQFVAEAMTDEVIASHPQYTEADRPLLMLYCLRLVETQHRENATPDDLDSFDVSD